MHMQGQVSAMPPVQAPAIRAIELYGSWFMIDSSFVEMAAGLYANECTTDSFFLCDAKLICRHLLGTWSPLISFLGVALLEWMYESMIAFPIMISRLLNEDHFEEYRI